MWWWTALGVVAQAAGPPSVPGDGVVSSDHAVASRCGAEVLDRGGNAADAAVATALCAGVVQPAGSGLGGGGFALVVPGADRPAVALDFRETAPAAATVDLYVGDDGEVDRQASRHGGLAVATPGESRGLATLHARFGALPAPAVARPAIRLATRGFRPGPHLVHALQATEYDEVTGAMGEGDHAATIRRPALARTLRRWARTGGEDLHTGRGAEAMASHVQGDGGILTASDLAEYAVAEREPVVTSYRGHTVVSFPPPSSGGIALSQMLGALEVHDLASLGHNSAPYIHRLVEAMKHAYADRAHHLGDPDFAEVPRERLLSEDRIAAIRAAFDPTRTLPPEAYGERIAPPEDAGTQHIAVLDDDGMAVSLTTTINTSFGAGLVPPSVGLVLNDEMDDFSAAPGVPNAYGLVGDEANAIAPGKRPLSSMTPTVVLDGDGEVVLVVGASGGSQIITGVLQVVLNVIDFGLHPAEAVARSRVHHQWLPDALRVEDDLPVEVIEALRALGHDVEVARAWSAVQAVVVDEEAGVQLGGADPRKGGRPAGSFGAD